MARRHPISVSGNPITLTFSASTATSFPLRLRIPTCVQTAHITVNGQDQGHPTSGTFFKIDCTWKPGDRVVLEFPMKLLVSERENHSVSVERGPLVYSLAIREKWRPIAHHPELSGPVAKQFPSYEVLPESPWDLALVLNKSDLAHSLEEVERKVNSTQPFSPRRVRPLNCWARLEKSLLGR